MAGDFENLPAINIFFTSHETDYSLLKVAKVIRSRAMNDCSLSFVV